jgi:hypothetical protein
LGIREEELSALSRYRAAGIFDDLEVLVMDLAVAMTSTPAHVPDELRSAVEGRVVERRMPRSRLPWPGRITGPG